jgi:GTP-binding protein
MPQTRFVTQKAFAMGLRPIVVVNKIDRDGSDPEGTVDRVFDLFAALEASDEQLDFPVIYASGRDGYAVRDLGDPRTDLSPLLEAICDHVPPPRVEEGRPFCMQASTLDYDDYLGYLAIGRIRSGQVRMGDRLLLARPGGAQHEFRVQKLLGFQGLKRFELAHGRAGDIVAVTGMDELFVGDTLTSIESPQVLPALTVDAPTMSMTFLANDGPLAGVEGTYVTSRNLAARLEREVKSNVALRVEETEQRGAYRVSGRGELHLAVLIETMRREGYELCVSQPRVILQTDPGGETLEPYEDVVVDVAEEYSGPVIEDLGRRTGQMTAMRPAGTGRVRLEYRIPTRGLIGYRSTFLTQTRGTGTLYHRFAEYGPWAGTIRARSSGVLIAQEQGVSNAYALFSLQERGTLFLGPQTTVYGGMIVGEHSRQSDLVVNPCRTKKLTNIRTHAADEKLLLTPPRLMTLEAALEFINEDELIEVTPSSIRMRKAVLDHNERRRVEKRGREPE